MLKSLKNRILYFFVLLAAIIAFTVFPLNYIHQQRTQNIQEAASELNELHLLVVQDINYTNEFLALDNSNPVFFLTGQSRSVTEHTNTRNKLLAILNKHKENTGCYSLDNVLLLEIERNYQEYCAYFDSLVYNVYRRGFQNTGLQGEINVIATELANSGYYRSKKIKEYQKEYFYHNDTIVASELLTMCARDMEKLSSTLLHNGQSKKELLAEYIQTFQAIVQLDKKIGLSHKSGQQAELKQLSDKLQTDIQIVLAKVEHDVDQHRARLNMLFALITLLLFISTIGLSIYLSRHLTEHIEKLTQYISKLVAHDFNYTDEKLSFRKSSTEIRQIYTEFRNMVAQIRIREKQRDAALRETVDGERRYRELTDLLPQSIFETDKLGNIEYANKAWFRAFGYAQEDLDEGLNLIEILQTNTENNLFGIDKIENSDYIAIRKNGERFAALVYADNIMLGNAIHGRRGIIIDATLRNKYIEGLQRETVRAVNSDKLKSSFLANMSHEIRTPMNSIIGFANLLSAEGMPEDQKGEFVEHIQSSGKILLNLIDDIIDIAKIEAGEIKIKQADCEPTKIIDELYNTFEGYKTGVGKANIKLVKHLPDDRHQVRTDPFRLRQILSNLTSNAIKFTDEGSVTIGYSIKNEQWIEFSVEDTGMGLTKEELNKVFSRFQRTQRSEDKNISGTGLGLAISKNLVELLGGKMWVSSVPDQGTRFWFHIPYVPVPGTKPNKHVPEGNTGNKQYNWYNKTVLIAEDDDNSFILLKSILQPTGARVLRAVNGREAVEAVKITDDIDLVLMDVQMPYLNGLDATERIKQHNARLPIIIQTAAAMEGDREKSVLAGCDDYLTKPVIPDNLLAKIEQFLPRESPNQNEKAKTEDAHIVKIKSELGKHMN